jgi:hypothetical protein
VGQQFSSPDIEDPVFKIDEIQARGHIQFWGVQENELSHLACQLATPHLRFAEFDQHVFYALPDEELASERIHAAFIMEDFLC